MLSLYPKDSFVVVVAVVGFFCWLVGFCFLLLRFGLVKVNIAMIKC